MSTGYECEYFQTISGEWYYAIQLWSCPRGAWDWREYSECYGPFKTEQETGEDLHNHHANPGGYSVETEVDPGKEPYKSMIADAQEHMKQRSNYARHIFHW
jgi:hypothetical protein